MHILYRSTNKHQTILVSICLTVRNKSTTNNKNGTALSKTILLHRVVLHLVELTYFDYHVLSSSSSSGASAGSSCCLPLVPQIGRAHVELQSLMRISYAVFCLTKKKKNKHI